MSCYSGGRICRIKLQNFLTYDNLEVFPSSGLNLIIGLNGTGKSSIVCGICLGLAGKPQFTGRATQISDYIKHGCKIADIEIELENKDSTNVIINRKIKQDNKSSWMLNGKTVQFNTVSDVIKQFNIQTDNLCQFLPQEKVSEFSKMDKKQRLENMLQAIGDQNLYQVFNDLKSLQKNFCDHDQNVFKLRDDLEMEKQKNERLQVEVERANEKTQLESVIKLLEERKKCLYYEELRAEYEELRQLKKNRSAQKKECKAKKENLEAVGQKMQDELQKNRQNIKSLDDDLTQKSMKVILAAFSNIKEVNQYIKEAKIELANKIDEKNEQKRRIQHLKQQIVGLKNTYDNYSKKYEDINSQEDIYKEQKNNLQEAKSDIVSKKKGISIDKNYLSAKFAETSREIVDLKNEDSKKMEVLKQIDRQTYEAAVWLNNNRDKFRDVVHLPIMISIKVHKKGDEKYIESHIPFKDMVAFVCNDPEDSKLFIRILRGEKKLAINTVLTPKEPLSAFPPNYSIEALEQVGFNCFLKDLFTAPDAVMRYLCNVHSVHETPVGGENAENFIKSSNFPFRTCYTSKNKYVFKTSRYGSRNKSITSTSLRYPRLLVSSMDVTDKLKDAEDTLKHLIQEIENHGAEYNTLEEEETRISMKIETLRKNLKVIEDSKRNLQFISANLNQKESLLQVNESKIINEEHEKKETSMQISKFYKCKVHSLNVMHDEIKVLLANREKKLKFSFYYSILLKKFKKSEKLLREANEEFERAKEKFESIKVTARKVFEKSNSLYEECEKINDKFKNCNSETTKYILNITSVEDVDQEIQTKQAQVELTPGTDQSVIDEYHRRIKDIADLQRRIKNSEDGATNLQTEIQQKKYTWLASLEGHLKRTNEKFNSYYKLLKCVGEIILDKNNDSNEFDKYGLQIMIKYRDSEPLTELSHDHHSGGECSVAAILFILSLQELTDVPFRCIDEINQGMDSINERKVFELIASSACNEKSSQYFLLTPKLLTDLPYHENMKIHVIYNGPFMGISWTLEEILENRRNCD